MLSKFRNDLLNILALAGFFAGFYPVILMLRYAAKAYIEPFDLLFNAGLLLTGYVLSEIILRNEKPGKCFIAGLSLREVILYLTLLIPVSAAVIVYRYEESGRFIMELTLSFILYYIGISSPFRDFTEILNSRKMILGIIALSVTLTIDFYFIDRIDFKIFNFGIVFFAVSMILKNQENLEYVFIGGKQAEFIVPEYIRRYNILSVLFFFLFILLIFYLKPVIMVFLQYIWSVVRYILLLILKLLSFLKPVGTQHSGRMGMMILPREEGNPLDWLVLVIAVVLTLFILFKWGPQLLKAIVKGIINLLKLFTNIYRRRFAADIADDYIDEDEFVIPAYDKNKPGFLERLGFKGKKSIKLWKITDPVLRVRAIFRLILEAISKGRVEVNPSDTANEILAKSSKIKEIHPDFDDLTGVYEYVRYGDYIPDAGTMSKAEYWYKKIIMSTKKGKSMGI